ncbi:MAG: 4-(cytidine 5'-diphospho)-2-C-methyl-D-erythritol kinase [Oscillospiraceae bacterium]|nr:4-(cytidine 5'-diphospho)-2-C-methyl-D-erythritol kinase [Oscillospiraceae bacterium]
MIITKKAYAKINLSLKILEKLENDYHKITTVMQRISLCDIIKAEITEGDGNIKIICSDKSLETRQNTAYKAAELFFGAARLNADMTVVIEKNIPVFSGLGGGSSDAAAVLFALNEYFNYPLPENRLSELAVQIGADVPFFAKNISCALCGGIGEIITPYYSDLTGRVLVAKAVYNISTKRAFSDWDKLKLEHGFKNDFSALAFYQNKNLREIYDIMVSAGAAPAELTGSGSALYGIFGDIDRARECENILKRRDDMEFCGIYDFI